MEVKLTGKELIETLNNFVGRFVWFDINNVFWSGTLNIEENRDLGTVFIANKVRFYIFKGKTYRYSFDEWKLTIEEVK